MRSSRTESQAKDDLGLQELLRLGTLGRPRGVGGDIVLCADAAMVADLPIDVSLVVTSKAGARSLQLTKLGFHKLGATMHLAGIDTREAADELKGAGVSIRRADLPPLQDGQYYDADLVGADVVDDKGKVIGSLKEVIATGANDVYSIATEDGEALVAAVGDVITSIDLEKRRIVVDPLAVVWPESDK